MGVWRRESELMAGMLSKFPNTLIMYMEGKNSNVRDCSSGSEKALAPHSSILAWKIPWMEEPTRLQSMGSLRVGQD